MIILRIFLKSGYVKTIFLALVVGANFVAFGLMAALTKSDWSGWVQAVGSLAALGVAIFVMSRQNAHSTKVIAEAEIRAVKRRALAVKGIVDRACNQFDGIGQSIISTVENASAPVVHSRLATARAVLGDLQTALGAIQVHELGSYELAVGVYRIVEICGNYFKIIDKWHSEEQVLGHAVVVEVFSRLEEETKASHAYFAAALEALE